ncbi:putative nitrogen fixation protein [Beggiatoa alba B18LD]|uniref:Putative nitrogen fixation protein n=1 Tax=Beggiatoa alba B18LD TaxID=395493 RepID=I3CDK8_9GAMM|nr:NifX-associated nitrogen fixation protein [Beggiatoa alba]EIJ41701.1 putative nitrogen fixation protein [Beggiatoa alba B18LD]
MSTGLALAIEDDNPLLASDFCAEMVKQMRALDTYDMYEKWSVARILSPLVLTKERKAEIPVIGDPDDITMSRVKAYYNAIASLIEKQSEGLMAVPMINLSHEGFGRAIITIGKLVVVDKTLRDVHRFGFKSLENMHEEATKIVDAAVERLNKYREVAEL